jgi:hypothetical protein
VIQKKLQIGYAKISINCVNNEILTEPIDGIFSGHLKGIYESRADVFLYWNEITHK